MTSAYIMVKCVFVCVCVCVCVCVICYPFMYYIILLENVYHCLCLWLYSPDPPAFPKKIKLKNKKKSPITVRNGDQQIFSILIANFLLFTKYGASSGCIDSEVSILVLIHQRRTEQHHWHVWCTMCLLLSSTLTSFHKYIHSYTSAHILLFIWHKIPYNKSCMYEASVDR